MSHELNSRGKGKVRVGSMKFGSENKLFVYHGVERSVKQPQSPEQAICQWGKGGGVCISVEMNLILG